MNPLTTHIQEREKKFDEKFYEEDHELLCREHETWVTESEIKSHLATSENNLLKIIDEWAKTKNLPDIKDGSSIVRKVLRAKNQGFNACLSQLQALIRPNIK